MFGTAKGRRRFAIYGAGAVGGIVGGLLFDAGHDVVLIARGPHYDAIRRYGLRLETPIATKELRIPVVESPELAQLDKHSIVLMAMKSQDTEEALHSLSVAADPKSIVVCLQNGVENERRALRLFDRVYSGVVMSTMSHLDPGIVQSHTTPNAGMLDIGQYPEGVDDDALEIVAALRDATFKSEALPDIMRWKYAKLIRNLSSAVTAICGPQAANSQLVHLARREGEEVLQGCGLSFASVEEVSERQGGTLPILPTESGPWRGGSSWQSVTRRTGSIESDALSGEVVLLGRLAGIPTPVNSFLQRESKRVAMQTGRTGGEDPRNLLSRALQEARLGGPAR
jgi:2-dehydropantoate 2-reductase